MRLPFRRRKILDVGPSGLVTELKIPFDPQATDDVDALVRHFRRLSNFDPPTIAAMMGTRIGSLFFGSVKIKGPRVTRDMLEDFDKAVPATPGSLSVEEYEEFLYGDSPLMREVFRRLRAEQAG